MPDRTPSLHALWVQAGGGTEGYDNERYLSLLREHGLLLRPGDADYETASVNLPCGWPHRSAPAHRPGPRCEITELLVSECSHCTGRGERVPERDTSAYGPWFPARFPGRCVDCDGDIETGDPIRADGEGGYLCETCGSEANDHE